ncbi:M13 family metallopeptidase [Qipengyuania aquimaris]|uniref:M13 family metallopeptidase n=1 Tax=Qipengyuania aquimaris TaxID=255984 RepID=A0A9Q3RZK3_9SPHN|nr:M13 family metallopeptidase [Qipengyuania aquimaris]MBY6217351.1 M13 family metallopeptidase [Qipengyuania aquimaris]
MLKAHLLATVTAGLILTGCSSTSDVAVAEPPAPVATNSNPDELDFALVNMDRSVDPGDDFYRYAAGGWLDRVERPESMGQLSFMTLVTKRMGKQLEGLVSEAATSADSAPEGSPIRQVGTLWNAFMDEQKIETAGLAPLQPELDRLAAVSNNEELAAYLAHFGLITGQWPFMELDVFEGISDATQGELYLSPGNLSLNLQAIYEMPADAPPRKLFEKFAADTLMTAGVREAEAMALGADAVAIETILHNGKTDPVLMVDYRNWNNPRTIAQVQEQIPELPLQALLEPLGLGDARKFTVTHKDYPAAVSQVLSEYSIEQIKAYLSFRLLQTFSGVMASEFSKPAKDFNAALGFPTSTPPRSNTAMGMIRTVLPLPLGQLYVENFFDPETKTKGEDMIRRIQAAFRARVERNEWLDEPTRAEALRKIDGFYYEVGIPDRWVDYSNVEIGDDMVQNVINVNTFWIRRELSGAGEPIDRWAFSDPTHTAPINVNAAYNPSANGFEVTAGIAQPPAFQADMDAPIYFCRLGAVIGHEMTHGFDSGGRLFDSTGSLRDWFTEDDTAYFEKEAQKLVEQGDKYEPIPGSFMKGGLTVKENLADIGGISLAHDALMTYLAENPEENVEIDGLNPSQRCFIAWAQMWAEKASEQTVKLQLEDNHAPGPYRTYAPLQHLDAFYEAFDVEEGDPMWLAPEKRVNIW